jgi:hypothetical protein
VIDAYRQRTHPERLSPLVQPTQFDLAAWQRDPIGVATAYASIAEPGRALYPNEDGDAPPLELLSPSAVTIPAGGSTEIHVRLRPFAPVSVNTSDKGVFPNGLVYGTAVAGADGIAVIPFNAPSGVVNDVRVSIASPVNAGGVSVIITVEPAQGLMDLPQQGKP